MTSPLYAANNFIDKANVNGVNLTHLKLQKLLYILYARFLAVTEAPLFPDRFEAWQLGPVLREVYDIFNIHKAEPIIELRPNANGKVCVIRESGDFGKCFDEVWAKYGRESAHDLVETTHQKDSAWSKTVARDGGIGGFLDDADIAKDGAMWFE